MSETAYFDTPERVERAQLLVHLINNTDDVLYLRGPSGAGKTRFLQQLLPDLESDYAITWHTAGESGSLERALPVAQTPATGDPELDLLAQENERPELLLIDNADRLIPEEIRELRQRGSNGRVLLLGTGGPAQGLEGLPLQFVDLPPFSEVQTREFIQSQGKLGHAALDQKMVLSLHRAAGGQPGPLLEALASLPPVARKPVAEKKSAVRQAMIDWKWILLAGVLVTLLGAVLVFQDRINAWFVADGDKAVEATLPEEPSERDAFHSGIREIEPGDVDTVVQGNAEEVSSPLEPVPDITIESPQDTIDAPAAPGPELAEKVADEEPADPLLDAVIDAAISAAEQAPQEAPGDTRPQVLEAQQNKVDPIPVPPAEAPPAKPGVVAPESPAVVMPQAHDPKPPKTFAARRGQEWLRAQPGKNYTLQLVGSRDRASIDRFIRKQGLSGPHAVFSRDLDGQPWYSLVSGSYPSREAAIAARKRLPAGLSGVWPRTFASIRAQVAGR